MLNKHNFTAITTNLLPSKLKEIKTAAKPFSAFAINKATA
jgi:hypothetical protein